MAIKNNLLELLETNRGFYISGEQIASTLEVSRTAVWKAMKALQKDGYLIEAVTNRGYCLSENSDILSLIGMKKYLSEYAADLSIKVHKHVASTNDLLLKEMQSRRAENLAIIADEQTTGRGRFGRNFYSPPGSGIYMSLLIKVNQPVNEAVLITCAAAVAVCRAIEIVCGKDAGIKWVNDILVDGRKVCGILTESSLGLESGILENAVIGIGLNVYTPAAGFPEEIKDIAGAILPSRQGNARNRLAAEILSQFMYYCRNFHKKDYINEYRQRSLIIGKRIMVLSKEKKLPAKVLAIDERCRLHVRYDDGTEDILSSGAISLCGCG